MSRARGDVTIYVGRDDLWERFVRSCEASGMSPSAVLREYMAAVVRAAKQAG